MSLVRRAARGTLSPIYVQCKFPRVSPCEVYQIELSWANSFQATHPGTLWNQHQVLVDVKPIVTPATGGQDALETATRFVEGKVDHDCPRSLIYAALLIQTEALTSIEFVKISVRRCSQGHELALTPVWS